MTMHLIYLDKAEDDGQSKILQNYIISQGTGDQVEPADKLLLGGQNVIPSTASDEL